MGGIDAAREFKAEILENAEIAEGIYNLWIRADEGIHSAPGQFVNVYMDRPDMLLPRPISICGAEGDRVRLVYQIAGKGTEYLSGLKPVERICVVGPLGNGFTIDFGAERGYSTVPSRHCGLDPQSHADADVMGSRVKPGMTLASLCNSHVNDRSHQESEIPGRILLLGGGIGVPPLLYFAKTSGPAIAVLGFRSASAVILADEFTALGCETIISTDDGSMGYKGNVIDLTNEVSLGEISTICACGPRAMLRSVAEYAAGAGIPCQVSMEEHMGCGIGACLCCPVPILENGARTYKKLCADGPVFDAASVIWEDM